jgi:hypothetical protein
MAPLAQALEAKLPQEGARTLVEDPLLRNVTFIGVAPVGTALGEIIVRSSSDSSCARDPGAI